MGNHSVSREKQIFSRRLRRVLDDKNMKQIDLSKALSISKGMVSQYLSGNSMPETGRIYEMSKVLGVSHIWLLGADVNPDGSAIDMTSQYTKIPILGKIAAGQPIYAEQQVIDYCQVPKHWHVDFALTVKGESMKNIGITDGSLVLVRKVSTVESGDIAVCMVDDEVTLKRYKKYDGIIVLHPENETMQDMIYPAKEADKIKILGKAIKLVRDI